MRKDFNSSKLYSFVDIYRSHIKHLSIQGKEGYLLLESKGSPGWHFRLDRFFDKTRIYLSEIHLTKEVRNEKIHVYFDSKFKPSHVNKTKNGIGQRIDNEEILQLYQQAEAKFIAQIQPILKQKEKKQDDLTKDLDIIFGNIAISLQKNNLSYELLKGAHRLITQLFKLENSRAIKIKLDIVNYLSEKLQKKPEFKAQVILNEATDAKDEDSMPEQLVQKNWLTEKYNDEISRLKLLLKQNNPNLCEITELVETLELSNQKKKPTKIIQKANSMIQSLSNYELIKLMLENPGFIINLSEDKIIEIVLEAKVPELTELVANSEYFRTLIVNLNDLNSEPILYKLFILDDFDKFKLFMDFGANPHTTVKDQSFIYYMIRSDRSYKYKYIKYVVNLGFDFEIFFIISNNKKKVFHSDLLIKQAAYEPEVFNLVADKTSLFGALVLLGWLTFKSRNLILKYTNLPQTSAIWLQEEKYQYAANYNSNFVLFFKDNRIIIGQIFDRIFNLLDSPEHSIENVMTKIMIYAKKTQELRGVHFSAIIAGIIYYQTKSYYYDSYANLLQSLHFMPDALCISLKPQAPKHNRAMQDFIIKLKSVPEAEKEYINILAQVLLNSENINIDRGYIVTACDHQVLLHNYNDNFVSSRDKFNGFYEFFQNQQLISSMKIVTIFSGLDSKLLQQLKNITYSTTSTLHNLFSGKNPYFELMRFIDIMKSDDLDAAKFELLREDISSYSSSLPKYCSSLKKADLDLISFAKNSKHSAPVFPNTVTKIANHLFFHFYDDGSSKPYWIIRHVSKNFTTVYFSKKLELTNIYFKILEDQIEKHDICELLYFSTGLDLCKINVDKFYVEYLEIKPCKKPCLRLVVPDEKINLFSVDCVPKEPYTSANDKCDSLSIFEAIFDLKRHINYLLEKLLSVDVTQKIASINLFYELFVNQTKNVTNLPSEKINKCMSIFNELLDKKCTGTNKLTINSGK